VALALAVAVTGGLATPAAEASHSKSARKAARKKLLREIKRNPRVVRRPGFVRKASHLALDMPVTFRLNPKINHDNDPGTPVVTAPSDDLIELDLGADTTGAPFPVGFEPGVATTALSGQFQASIRFGRSTIGYGTLGLTEMSIDNVLMTAPGVTLVEGGCPLLRTGTISMSESPAQAGDRRGGTVNLVAGTFAAKLYVQTSFNSLRRDDCSSGYFWTDLVPSSAPPPMVLQMSGGLNVSPAFSADGSLRLFTVRVDDAVTPQPDLAATLRTCTAPTGAAESDPAPTTTCAGEPMDARAKVERFSAEILLGHRPG
jgi:hypothetical protein